MAQLKNSVVQGSLRVTDTTITTDLMVTATKTARYAFIAPTSNGAPTWRALTKADISDFPTSMTPASHTHGNITNDGKIGSAGKKYFVIVGTDNKITTLSTTEIGSGTTKFLREDGTWVTPSYIANAAYGNISTSGTIGQTSNWALQANDALVVADANNSNKLERTNIKFDASTTTKWLNQKGEWSTPTKGDLGLGNVENTALSTWTGTNKITTVGTISTGTWQGTAIASSYIGNLPGSKITSGTVAAAYLGTMTGATSSAAGASGAVPQPAAGKQTAYLRGDGTWQPAPVLSIGGLTGAITLDQLGISGAMHYRGTVSAIPPASGTYNSGDVVVLSGTVKEYVYDGTNWRELGTEGSFKTTQTAVSDPTAGSSGQINFINSISQNTNGVITVTKQPVRVASTSQTGVIQITKDNANSFLNSLDTGSSTPVDNDYYISQYVSGGTTTTTYHRRPMSALYAYVKGKTDAIYSPKVGSTSITTVGTVTSGVWQGTAISSSYIGSHNHSADNITSGTLPIARGGTGKTTLTAARQQFNGPEFIVGTWTAASGTWTGVTTDSELYEGKQIILYMPFGGSGNATLNLTLSGGGTTGAKNVYYESNSRFTTHKGQNSQLHLIYHENLKLSDNNTYTGWWYIANRDINDGQYYARYWSVKAAEAITSGNVIAGTTTGYKHLKTANMTFDITYPVLYAGSNISSGSTSTNNYIFHYAITITTTHNQTYTASQPVFIKGTLSGTTFTPVSTTPLTQTIPSTEDNFFYYYIGHAYSASAITFDATARAIYQYKNGAFQLYSGASSYAIVAASANSVAWSNVSSRPTNLNQFTNGPGYVTSSGVTSITLKAGAGITLDTDNTAITSTGTRTISITGLNTSSGSETKWLNQKGGWSTPSAATVGAATTNHTHDISITQTGTATVTLAANTAYTLTAGGKTVVFKTPADSNTWNAMGGATSAANGTVGYINAVPPKEGYNTTYWRADGSWAVPYTHPTGDGNLHVPATGTSNNGKVLKAGSTAGSISWSTLSASDVGAAPSSTISCTTANVKTALGTGSGTTKFLREDGSWQTPAYIANAAYGNISTSGTITSNGVALANGDYLLFSDASNNGKIERTSITIGTATNTWLRNDGTWATPSKADISLGNVENTKLSTWAGSANITTLGTITTGTWNATTIGGSYLGTMVGATSSTAGVKGAVPAPAAGDQEKYLQGDGTWDTPAARHGMGTGAVVEGSPADGANSLPKATGTNSHAEGLWTEATGNYSHAEGYGVTASGYYSHAEGQTTAASGSASHTEGYYTIANHAYQHVFGEYNIGDTSTAAATERGNFIEIVGNGTASNSRSNARTLDWDGNETISGDYYKQLTSIKAIASNNNVSSDQYFMPFRTKDTDNRFTNGVQSVIKTAGPIGTGIVAYNYDSSGNSKQNYLIVYAAKDGTQTYSVANPANFCSAIGAIGASGGTITGQIKKAGVSTSWVSGRDNAALRMTSISGYSPCISVKTTNGTWEMGAYDYSTHTDRLIFTYITDSNYNSDNNAVTGQVQFLGGGHVVANYYYGNGSQLTGLTKSQITNWEDRFTCTQVWNNSSPTSNFNSQTIYLTSYGYTLYLIKVRNSTSNNNYSYEIINADSQTVKICNAGYSDNAIRTVSAASNYMNFGNAQHASSSTNNAYCIPTTIWGLS